MHEPLPLLDRLQALTDTHQVLSPGCHCPECEENRRIWEAVPLLIQACRAAALVAADQDGYEDLDAVYEGDSHESRTVESTKSVARWRWERDHVETLRAALAPLTGNGDSE